ncbi:DUF6352 family protein [Salinarimonas ramus]|uniref:Uncharacterized protein n=1 Tax=Salinarimonas ramus TaxID=690164 RepID=A0A917QD82_9HYPH|nr:DUF6352 family protein [Salinarimonas ramus]GGK45207.1 hypothetical protein GCM10011322_35470 [Salinarimonas ramus]
MKEFWVSSGHHLTRRTPEGALAVTDELLLAYLARPEILPPEEACDAERALHAALTGAPRRPVSPGEIAALADPDARENWEFFVSFRDRLVAAGTVEAAYAGIVRDGAVVPPLFLSQMVHLVLRNALDGCADPYTLRAAELFFRPQKVSTYEGATLLADLELIEEFEGRNAASGPVSPLVGMLGKSAADELDVLDDGNAWTYWSRSDAHTMALPLGSAPKARDGLARAIEAFVSHMHGVSCTVTPMERIEDEAWRWFVGLDADATAIGNRLWRGEPVGYDDQSRVLCLLRLDLAKDAPVEPRVRNAPIWLILAMSPEKVVRMKPQNLVTGLPLARRT